MFRQCIVENIQNSLGKVPFYATPQDVASFCPNQRGFHAFLSVGSKTKNSDNQEIIRVMKTIEMVKSG
jgi:hypothetical protein